ncbi:MAG: 2-oxoacid:acceptor oxidoreductase subunit alpha [Patescibacteria group bacterium]|jgi:2-oxoglutarate ferredoxin oxidoreductase subunit alpha
MQKNSLRWKIGGAAGYGIMATGLIFSKSCARGGLFAFDYAEYPSLIRGGHNSYMVHVKDRPIYSHDDRVDLLVALNTETVEVHRSELEPGAGIVYDPDVVSIDAKEYKTRGYRLFPVPLLSFAKEKGEVIMQNMVALGASFALLKYPFDILERTIQDTFGSKKNNEVALANIAVARSGYEYIEKQFSSIDFPYHLEPHPDSTERLVISGNEALALGAIQAGCKFYVAYPMSPSSSILHTMAAYAEKYGIVVKHAEDEISVINMAIGAAWTGARAMLGTSGGGFSLMVEALGLAGITETPLVVVNAQRPGPATGLPTWTEQADLRFVLHAAQGEFPRFVLAPGDIEECFYMAGEALNLAEKYQTPVIILLDKYLSESHATHETFDISRVQIERGELLHERDLEKMTDYRRYALTESGISPRSLPGTKNGLHLANSDEHDAYGFTDESSENRTEQMEKRMQKLVTASKELAQPKVVGTAQAAVTIISWGSTKGPIREAMTLLEGTGVTVNNLHLTTLWPFPSAAVSRVLSASKRALVVEGNATGQLFGMIREMTGIEPFAKILKFDGRPFHPTEIKNAVEEIIHKHA